jgi:hypothetical protein
MKIAGKDLDYAATVLNPSWIKDINRVEDVLRRAINYIEFFKITIILISNQKRSHVSIIIILLLLKYLEPF